MISSIILAIIIMMVMIVMLRAFTAKVVTGKWPHQSKEAQRIFDDLP